MTTERPGAWDFAPVLELLHALSGPLRDDYPTSTKHHDEIQVVDPNENAKRPPSLGNFDNIYKHFGRPIEIEPYPSSLQTFDGPPSLSGSFSSSSSSLHTSEAEHFDDFVKNKTVKWDDSIDSTNLEARPRHNVSSFIRVNWNDVDQQRLLHRLALEDKVDGVSLSPRKINKSTQARKEGLTARVAASFNITDESEGEISSYNPAFTKNFIRGGNGTHLVSDKETQRPQTSLPSAAQLRPTWVTPHPGTISEATLSTVEDVGHPWSLAYQFQAYSLQALDINPILHLTIEEKVSRLLKKLIKKFGKDLRSLINSDIGRFITENHVSNSGIHVFVDSSNIIIGFQNYLKRERGINIRAYTRRPPFSFRALVVIMERGRAAARRVLVGSSRSHARPDYMTEAIRCGYEVSSLEPVEKFKERARIGGRRTGGGYGTSGPSSGSDTTYSGLKQVTEQGVDEILHMKMLESIVDTHKPSTMVLATGDAAEAEFSDGFLRNVERALARGWKVELVAWSDSLSSAYRSKDFLNKWNGRFSIIELDDFSEECLALCVPLIPTS